MTNQLTPQMAALYLGCEALGYDQYDKGNIYKLRGIYESWVILERSADSDAGPNEMWADIDCIRLILRRMEDMTEDEKRYYGPYVMTVSVRKSSPVEEGISLSVLAERVSDLLKAGFDTGLLPPGTYVYRLPDGSLLDPETNQEIKL